MAERKRLEDKESQRKQDDLLAQQNLDIEKQQQANLMNIMNTEEQKGNSKTVYKKSR